MAAVVDIKNQIGNIAIEIAEKVIRKELSGAENQEKYVEELIEDVQLN